VVFNSLRLVEKLAAEARAAEAKNADLVTMIGLQLEAVKILVFMQRNGRSPMKAMYVSQGAALVTAQAELQAARNHGWLACERRMQYLP